MTTGKPKDGVRTGANRPTGFRTGGPSGSVRDFVSTGLSRREQPLHLRELPDGCLAARTARQVPLEFPPFRRCQCSQDITRVVEASHVHHAVSFVLYFSADPSVIAQFGAVWLHQVPMCAELIESLAAAVTGIVVADVVIERVTVIGELRSPVGARGAAQVLRAGAGSAGRGGHRRPHVRAGAGTGETRKCCRSRTGTRPGRCRRPVPFPGRGRQLLTATTGAAGSWGDGRCRRRGGRVVAAARRRVRRRCSRRLRPRGRGRDAAGEDEPA